MPAPERPPRPAGSSHDVDVAVPARGQAAAVAVAREAALEAPGTGDLTCARVTLGDGASTAVYAAAFAPVSTELRVAVLRRPERLAAWCASRGITDAIVGGFFVRPGGVPLGELRTRGVTRRHVAFTPPWGGLRACVHVEAGSRPDRPPRRAARRTPAATSSRPGRCSCATASRASSARSTRRASRPARRSSTPTSPTAATRARRSGSRPAASLAVVCDGRSADDAGLTLEELAALLAGLGSHTAINLDGGGSTSLVSGGRLRNQPRAGARPPRAGRASGLDGARVRAAPALLSRGVDLEQLSRIALVLHLQRRVARSRNARRAAPRAPAGCDGSRPRARRARGPRARGIRRSPPTRADRAPRSRPGDAPAPAPPRRSRGRAACPRAGRARSRAAGSRPCAASAPRRRARRSGRLRGSRS